MTRSTTGEFTGYDPCDIVEPECIEATLGAFETKDREGVSAVFTENGFRAGEASCVTEVESQQATTDGSELACSQVVVVETDNGHVTRWQSCLSYPLLEKQASASSSRGRSVRGTPLAAQRRTIGRRRAWSPLDRGRSEPTDGRREHR